MLTFDNAGDLVGFVSRDRYQSDRVGVDGQTLWSEPRSACSYGRFELTAIEYNVSQDSM